MKICSSTECDKPPHWQNHRSRQGQQSWQPAGSQWAWKPEGGWGRGACLVPAQHPTMGCTKEWGHTGWSSKTEGAQVSETQHQHQSWAADLWLPETTKLLSYLRHCIWSCSYLQPNLTLTDKMYCRETSRKTKFGQERQDLWAWEKLKACAVGMRAGQAGVTCHLHSGVLNHHQHQLYVLNVTLGHSTARDSLFSFSSSNMEMAI